MRPIDPLPLPERPLRTEDDPVAVLAREAGRRAAAEAKARLRDKARRRAARAQARAAADAPSDRSAIAGAHQAPPATGQAARPQAARRVAAAEGLARPVRPRRRPQRHAASQARRRLRTLLATGALGALSLWAVSGLYQLLGRAPLPAENWTVAAAGPAMPAATALPGPAQPAAYAPPPAPPTPEAAATAPAVQSAATSPVPPPAAAPTGAAAPRVSTAGRGVAAVLPYLPGSQVVESDAEPQQAPGGGTTWAATLSSGDAVEKVAAYYRQVLAAGGQPGGAALTEVNPGPGQLLLSLGNPSDGSHSAVWIGASEGQTLIRLMRTQGPSATP